MIIVIGLVGLFSSVYEAWRRPLLMSLLSPVLAGAFCVYGASQESVAGWWFGGLIFHGILAAATVRSISDGASSLGRLVALWCVGLVLFLGIGVAFIAFGSFYGVMFDLLLVFSLVQYFGVARQARTAQIISTIAASLRQNLPLPTALYEAAGTGQDASARVLRETAKWLEQGVPLSEALQRSYRRCPGHVLGMARMAERVNQLPLAFAALEEDLVATVQSRGRSGFVPVNAWYPFVILCIELFVLTGLMYFVVPKFQNIFLDFDVPLPRSTTVVWGTLGEHAGWFWLGVILVIGGWLALRLRMWRQPRRPWQPHRLSVVGDWVKWHVPVVRWFEQNSSLGRLVESLRLSLRAGCTMNEALDQALELDLNHKFRGRLRAWRQAVNRGEDVAASARRCGLGRPLAWAFDGQVNPGNAPAVLDVLATFYRTNYSYRVNLARYVFWPVVILGLGVAVGFVVYAFFVPLVAMLYTCMDMTMP